MIFLTYNDLPSGIFFSQVTDTCNFLNKELHANIRLVSFISIRNFFHNRRRIKSQFPAAIVLPMFPKLRNWRWNLITLFFLFLFLDSRKIIARSAFACALALRLKKLGFSDWVCYDGRGAVAAEENEYAVSGDPLVQREIGELEKESVRNSDFRISVSSELVKYWRKSFSYGTGKHVVIPCTLHSEQFTSLPDENSLRISRNEMGFSNEDVLLVYSGSSAEWQSLHLLDNFLLNAMRSNPKVKALFLLKKNPGLKVMHEFQERVKVRWVEENQVQKMIAMCDYGLLLRTNSVTNQVASPVKFAEYLACGLKVLISPGIGDYSSFVPGKNCGFVVGENDEIHHGLDRISFQEKKELYGLACNNFSKASFLEEYRKLMDDHKN